MNVASNEATSLDFVQVIPRKDLPRIYTMCLPPSYQASSSGDQGADETHTLGQGLADLERTREDVVKEVCR